jgi:signal peptidase II
VTLKQRTYARLLGFGAAVVGVDQLTKQLALSALQDAPLLLIPDVLALRLAYNAGGAFGFLDGLPALFLIAGLGVVALILVWAGRLEDPALATPLGLVLGGGLGNLSDRVFRGLDGRVVDFIDLSFWPTFNVADSAIVVGVILIAVMGIRGEPARAGT